MFIDVKLIDFMYLSIILMIMSLSSLYLDAFIEVARQKSFSLAAKKLHVTQSALSQRILNLEQEVGSTLFLRESSGIRLTDLGHRLLRYCQSKELLEAEFLSSLQSEGLRSLSGVVRMGAFSTITRSMVMPLMAEFIKEHPRTQLQLRNQELRDLPRLLASGGADFIFTTQPLEKQGVESHHLGNEENVLVQSSAKSAREDIYLDHDEEDMTTYDFFKHQNRKMPTLSRSYLGEIYTIIDGVRLGLGRAVVPLHLVQNLKGLEVVDGYKSLKVPIYFSYYTQAFYTDLQKAIIERVLQGSARYLKG